jgi:hypothetical protein
VECLRLGRTHVEGLIKRNEHVKAAFEQRSRQYAEEDAKQESSGNGAGSQGTVGEQGSRDGAEGGDGSGVMQQTRGKMEPTTISSTMMSVLIECITKVSRAAARGSDLVETERTQGALAEEFESLQAAYKHQVRY